MTSKEAAEEAARRHDELLAEMSRIDEIEIPPYQEWVREMDERKVPCEADCGKYACWRKCCFPPEGYSEAHWTLCHQHRRAWFPREPEHDHVYQCITCHRSAPLHLLRSEEPDDY